MLILLFFWAEIQTNECLEGNGGCWQDLKSNITACKVSNIWCKQKKKTDISKQIKSSFLHSYRIRTGEGSVNALHQMVSNILEMDTHHVTVTN